MSQQINKATQDITIQANQKWNDVQVKCPTCQAMLTVPPPPALVFQCGGCGTQINRPTATSMFSHHADKIGDQITGGVNQALNQQTTMQIQVPAGVKGGDTIMAQASPGAPQISVILPPGAQPGQVITAVIPANAVPLAARAAVTTATPAAMPVATPVGPGGSSASGGVGAAPASGVHAQNTAASGGYAGAASASEPTVQGVVVTGIPVDSSTNEKS